MKACRNVIPIRFFTFSVMLIVLPCPFVFANPQGMTVASGTASSQQNGNQLQITTSQNTFLKWSSFNIASGETTIFNQPSATSIVWNQINDANPSQIYGSLQANGVVVLQNQNGFYFGPNSFVKAAGLLVTTATLETGSSAGIGWTFTGPPVSASIVNYGHIQTASGGWLCLLARDIENNGTLQSPGGSVSLVSGQKVLVSDRDDGRGISVEVKTPQGSVNNKGQITADAGQILLQANNVNQSGLLQADSVGENNGTIELLAANQINLTADSIIRADGADAGVSKGGEVLIKSGNEFVDASGSQISALGGGEGGNGGSIELSAPAMTSINSSLSAQAQIGYKSGSLLLDPTTINLSTSGSSKVGDSSTTLNLNINSAFKGFSQIALEATGNINFTSGAWDLASSTGFDSSDCLLTLKAGNNIVFSTGTTLNADNWSVSLVAGANLTSGGVVSGTGNVTLSGTSVIQSGTGNITVAAGNNVTIGTGAIRTIGGGDIAVTAVGGNVTAGSNPHGFVVNDVGNLEVSPDLGGISTAAGGDVTIIAGKNIKAYTPYGTTTSRNTDQTLDAGVGAFGSKSGNVTLIAGGNITGHYVVQNGVGTITAAGSAGSGSSTPLALSLTDGSWSVAAANMIYLSEVRNPNGVFNDNNLWKNSQTHLITYSDDASVSLTAGNQIVIGGGNLPRTDAGYPIIFAPNLYMTAGAGGIKLAANITLFPTATSELTIKTTDGGDFYSDSSYEYEIVLPGVAQSHWYDNSTDFEIGVHYGGALHKNDTTPVIIDVSGSISDINIEADKPVQMTATGNISGAFRFLNLHDTDVSFIKAGKAID